VLVAKRYRIGGRVQGVGFRYFTQDAARREGLRGYVRNLAHGGVEVAAEGDRDAIERFERAIHRGPGGAVVTSVEVEEDMPVGPCEGFEVRG